MNPLITMVTLGVTSAIIENVHRNRGFIDPGPHPITLFCNACICAIALGEAIKVIKIVKTLI